MLFKTSSVALALLVIMSSFLLFSFFSIKDRDRAAYCAYTAKEAPTYRPQHHNREGVTKDLYLYKEGERKHVQIKSRHSELAYSPEQRSLIERLYQIQCLIDDSCVSGIRRVQRLESQEGLYSYKELAFIADQVDISLLSCSDDPFAQPITPSAIFLEGRAKQLTLTMKEGLQMTTKQFKAHINHGAK